ncbi:MAG: hypothetical protein HOW73_10550 [Polyangiaceae bacterium]|nr:hypothetical protein [Polyangiaceae bacterium]
MAATTFSAQASAQTSSAAAPSAEPGAGPRSTTAIPETEDAVTERFPPSSARWRILVAGLGVTAVAYGGAALMGGLWEDIPGGDMLFIPVAGPWIALGKSGCAPGEESVEGEGDCEAMIGVRAAIYVVDGLLQLGGLGLVAESIFMTTESETAAPAKATILPAPIVTPTMVGLGVVGTF